MILRFSPKLVLSMIWCLGMLLGRTTQRTVCSAFAASSNLPSSSNNINTIPKSGHVQPMQYNLQPSPSSPPKPGWASYSSRTGTSALNSKSMKLSSIQEEEAKASMNLCGPMVQAEFGGQVYWDTSSMNAFRVFFILGGPGAGKGTQSELLKTNYPCVHLSVGELLRNVPTDSPHKQLVEECLVAGKIVPVEISLSLLQAAMEEARLANGPSLLFLVDGFPRNFDNLQGWVKCMSNEEIASVWGTLMFTCPLAELERRILARAETSGRSDDNLKSAQKRFATFERDTVPVVDTMRLIQSELEASASPSLKIVDIKGDQSLEKVWEDTQEVMNQFVSHDVYTANAKLVKALQSSDMETYESLIAPELKGTKEIADFTVANASIDFITGKRVIVSYDRSDHIRETRVWSHEGQRGWINVHFSRTPLP